MSTKQICIAMCKSIGGRGVEPVLFVSSSKRGTAAIVIEHFDTLWKSEVG